MTKDDRGSVTPLVLGLTVCLLLLGVGVIAATSAALAQRNIQHSCDSAAGYLAAHAAPGGQGRNLDGELAAFLQPRHPGAHGTAKTTDTAVLAHCVVQAPITFGSLFGHPNSEFSATSIVRLAEQ